LTFVGIDFGHGKRSSNSWRPKKKRTFSTEKQSFGKIIKLSKKL
jgi:hypothetical protein